MKKRFNGYTKSWEKDLAFLNSDLGSAKNLKPRKITVSVFWCAFKLTALLLKSFHLRLHCYTLNFTPTPIQTQYVIQGMGVRRSVTAENASDVVLSISPVMRASLSTCRVLIKP